MYRLFSLAAALIVVTMCPTVTRADIQPTQSPQMTQATQSRQHPFQLAIGGDFPTSQNAQQLVHTVYKLEAIYDLGPRNSVSLYSGYGWGSHSPVSGANVNFSTYWLGVQARTPDQIYGGLGAGYYGQSGTIRISGLGSANANHGGVGGTAFVGYDFSSQPFASGFGLRAGYDFLPNFKGLNTDGWNITLTHRF